MKVYALSLAALLLTGCGASGLTAATAQAPTPPSDRRVLSLLSDLDCGTVTGTGDSHPNDGKFYEITVRAEKKGTLSEGTVALYVMNDVLFGTNPVPEPVVYQGTVTTVAVGDHKALVKGVLTTGEPFTLRVKDSVTDAISEGPTYDYFSFSTEGLKVDDAYIHEGDLVVRSNSCN